MSAEPTRDDLRAAIARARARMRDARHDRTIEIDARCRVRRVTLPLLGTRIFLEGDDAPEDLRKIEIGAVIDGHLQLPETEFGMSPTVLRAIADLLEDEGEPDG